MRAISMDMVRLTGAIRIERVLDFTVTAKANEHATMEFTGIVAGERGLEDLRRKIEGEEMRLFCDGTPYFTGKIMRARLINEGGYFIAKVRCVSCSHCFDVQKRSRSFQDTRMTYGDMLESAQRQSGTGNIVVVAGRDEPIGYSIIQYEETDWEFTKRMASHFGTVVIPEITHGLPQISMGVIHGKEYEMDEHTEYEVEKTIGDWMIKRESNDCDIKAFIRYRVRDYRNFELGDKARFLRYPLIVMAKTLTMKNGLLDIEYELGSEQGYGLKKTYNRPIRGKSIEGKVIATRGENLKLHLDIDETQDKAKAYWYTWAPQTGNLFYCMPMAGTKARLYFPDRDEGNAIATECVRTNGGKMCAGMWDYESRQFVSEHDKGVLLSPEHIDFSGRSKKTAQGVSLTDGRGIGADSSRDIVIQAMGKLSFNAEGVVEVEAGKQMKLDKLGEKSGIEISGSEINKYAETIYHNGLPKEEAMKELDPVEKEFPAALFAGTAAAMLPASTKGDMDEAMVSVIGMTNISMSKF